jgi:hypothetical protein
MSGIKMSEDMSLVDDKCGQIVGAVDFDNRNTDPEYMISPEGDMLSVPTLHVTNNDLLDTLLRMQEQMDKIFKRLDNVINKLHEINKASYTVDNVCQSN